MIAELGQIALILALVLATIQATLPLIGAQQGNTAWMALARPAARGHLLFIAIAFALLARAFLVHDFSIAYVAQNSNTELPTFYLISAIWGAHEGSLLLWVLCLALWGGVVTWFNRSVPDAMTVRVISVMGMISVGFLLFILFTSNPFERLIPSPTVGRDLNPLLQDPGLIFHPPLLYMGYVGFAVPFAFAIAAMLGGRLDAAWARWSRPWTNIAWLFLTLGIALGSWWAYYELGWGGWWFWDPVENASFMPWLVGTALMHSLAVTEKRGAFKAWTVLLAIFTFSLSLLGTFLVRSGVLTSVHAFASDPTRGVFILAFLAVVVGSSLLLYALRAHQIRSYVKFDLISRETSLLSNNVLLVVVAASVLLGTLYPLALDALGMGKISVGPPYFNSIFIPLTIPLAILIGFAALVRWKQDEATGLIIRLRPVMVVSLVLGCAFPFLMGRFEVMAAVGMTLAFWVILATLKGLHERTVNRPNLWQGLQAVPRAYYGMMLGHIGVAVFIIGITLTSLYSTEKDIRLEPGQSYEMDDYTFTFHGVHLTEGPNYSASRGHVTVSHRNKIIEEMYPEKRTYSIGMPMTEAAINAGLLRDLFVAIGEELGTNGAWSLRIYHKPFVRWLWLGALFMACGGGLAASDRRYRIRRRENNTVAAGARA